LIHFYKRITEKLNLVGQKFKRMRSK